LIAAQVAMIFHIWIYFDSSISFSNPNLYDIAFQDSLVETAKEEASSLSNIIAQATK
jgi:hypothetical protein